MKRIAVFIALLLVFLASVLSGQDLDLEKDKCLLIRCDDFGMCHSVNMAIQRILEAEIPISVSVMFTCPWVDEAVEILRAHPEVGVGVHLTLNAEWKNYRWGPLLGAKAVPSLVDSMGWFFPSRSLLFGNHPETAEIEMELRAQIERALAYGIRIDYMDTHMGAAVETGALRSLVENLAREYGLGISTYFGEIYSNSTYSVPLEEKTGMLASGLDKLISGKINLQVMHVGLDSPEMAALIDCNAFGLKEMSRHRQSELEALLSEDFRASVKENRIRLVTYRDLIEDGGLTTMKRP